jgi:transposase
MSRTSKSPKKVAEAAYHVAENTLPQYSHRFSPRKFTQPQIFVCLVLKIFFKTDYRGIVAILNDSPDLCKTFNLSVIPHFTTLQKASKRLLCLNIANQLLESSVRVANEGKEIKLAAVDSTGLEAGHISRYFVRRKRSKQLETYEETHYRRWPKLAIACDCSNHMILSAITIRGPSVDINQFERILTPAINRHIIEHVLADAGYDSESNHRFARDTHNIKSTIPPKHGRPTTKPFLGKYRRLMQQEFGKEIFGQRWQVETVFSMIKRNQGEALLSKSYWAQNREMMLKVLTHNIGIIMRVNELFYRARQT